MKTEMKRVNGPDDVPEGEHYAVLVYNQTRTWIPGDERSRTSPGHGYPERTEVTDSFEHYVTTDKEVWINYIQSLESQKNLYGREKEKYVALRVAEKAKISTQVQVRIS